MYDKGATQWGGWWGWLYFFNEWGF